MKLFVLALCVCAAMAEVHWDKDGDYRLIETKPVELLQYKIMNEPLRLQIKGGPANAKYEIVGKPMWEDYPLVYKYLTPALYPSIDTSVAALAFKSSQPFVYSYKQVNSEA